MRALAVLAVGFMAFIAVPMPAGATVVFSDSFDSYPIAVPVAGASLGPWSIDRGSIDVVGTGGFPELCLGGPSPARCIDLDGTSAADGQAGTISHSEPTLGTGSYVLSFWLSGNNRGFPDDSLTVSFGSYSEVFTLPSSSPWTQYTRNVSYAGPTGLTLTFDLAGTSDLRGILLDDVSIAAVPEPGTLLLLGSGLSALALRRRRKA
jgi:hypothetical protein